MSMHPSLSDGVPGLVWSHRPPLHCIAQTLRFSVGIMVLSPCEPGVCFCRVCSLLPGGLGLPCHGLATIGSSAALHCAHHVLASSLAPVRHCSQERTQRLAPAAQFLARSPEI